MKTFIALCFSLLLLSNTLVGQNPTSLKWKQIKIPHFKVIFPSELDVQANYAAKLLEKSFYKTSNIFKNNPKPIKLFLFNQLVTSNGYVGLAPRRMVWYTTPSQKSNLIGTNDWFQTLAIHEFRHVVQFSKLDTNITNFAGTLFGDFGRGFLMNWSMPLWFFEGDAVYAETQLSNNGRGRMPSFYRDIYSLESSGVRYSYQKAYLGSYKDYFPNWYHLGFLMTNHVISNYGDSTWRNVVEKSTKISISPFAFSHSLRKQTGYNVKKTYQNALNEFKIYQDSIKENVQLLNINVINTKQKKVFTNYYYPAKVGTDSIFAFKRGYNHRGALIQISNNNETELVKINPSGRVHFNRTNAVWSITVLDIRWSERSYSDVVVYNLKNGNRKRITTKQKLFAPAISPDNTRIAAVEYNTKMECSLVIIDIIDGSIISKFKSPMGTTFRNPSWNTNSDKIVATSSFAQNNKLVVFNLKNGKKSTIKSFGSENISNPVFYKNYILYNSPYKATDAIYAIDTANSNIYLVVNSNFGVYNATVSHKSKMLFFQDYKPDGFDIAYLKLDKQNWKKINSNYIDNRLSSNSLWNDKKSDNIYENFNSDSISQLLTSKKYSPVLNSIRVHSWAPYPVNGGIGFNVFADDELYTTHAKAGIEYYPKDMANRLFANVTYAGLFPEFSINYSNGRKYMQDTASQNNLNKIDENVIGFNVMIPLNFSKFNYNRNLTLTSGLDKIYQKNYVNDTNHNTTNYSLVNIGFGFSQFENKAYRDVMTKQGIEFSTIYHISVNLNSNFKNRSTTKLTTYLPAPFNHGFKLTGGIETNNTNNNSSFIYQLNTDLEIVYGYNKPSFTPDYYLNGLVLYGLPLFYPDMALGSIIYCKRIRANLFYNHGLIKKDDSNIDLSSYGAEFHGEFNFFNLIFPIEFGVRISYRTYDTSIAYEFMLMGIPF